MGNMGNDTLTFKGFKSLGLVAVCVLSLNVGGVCAFGNAFDEGTAAKVGGSVKSSGGAIIVGNGQVGGNVQTSESGAIYIDGGKVDGKVIVGEDVYTPEKATKETYVKNVKKVDPFEYVNKLTARDLSFTLSEEKSVLSPLTQEELVKMLRVRSNGKAVKNENVTVENYNNVAWDGSKGENTVYISSYIDGTKETTSALVKIVDKVKPNVKVKNKIVTLELGANITAQRIIEASGVEVSDNVTAQKDISVDILDMNKRQIDFANFNSWSPGETIVTIKATDKNGNANTAAVKIIVEQVKEKIKLGKSTLSYKLGEVATETDILNATNSGVYSRTNGILQVQDFSSVNFHKAGEYVVQIASKTSDVQLSSAKLTIVIS